MARIFSIVNTERLCVLFPHALIRQSMMTHTIYHPALTCGYRAPESLVQRGGGILVMKIRIDRTGKTYGRLTVESASHRDESGKMFWNCVCACGAKLAVSGSHLSTGHTLSCGCYLADKNRERKTHGEAARKNHSREYNVWAAMRARCKYPSVKAWPDYGGRGITVCERWDSFANFIADMGRCPQGMTLERVNNNGNYEPDNCIWATRDIQANNKRNNVQITINGVTKTLTQWARLNGISPKSVGSRLQRGWDKVEAVTTPVCQTR